MDFDETIQGINLGLASPLDAGDTIGGTGYGYSRREVESIETLKVPSLDVERHLVVVKKTNL